MDVEGKNKDNIKAREDLTNCKRPELELSWNNGRVVKLKASFTLSMEQQRDICIWLEELKLPIDYASNISRCVSIDENRFF